MRNRREDAGKKRSKKRGRRNCNEGDRPNPHGFPGKIRDSEAERTDRRTKEFRDANALRGLEEYSHLWLIWEFSEAVRDTWSPMVRPPRLGGNKRVGVFATRSPFRPNPIGLSSVKLEYVEQHPSLGPVLHLTGADLMDGTPILDIKPYLPHVDSHVEALGSFTEKTKEYFIPVEIPDELLEKVPADHRAALKKVLEQDPRPSYQNSEERVYGLSFAGMEIKFQVKDEVLHVVGVEM